MGNRKYFYGLDQCMGCYENEHLFIKFEFFINYKTAKNKKILQFFKKKNIKY